MSDSIDADLLDYYQRELTWLRHAGGAFAERYPKVARRLQLAPGECPDPHVERLLEGFSLLTARLQRRLDDDYAEFSDALLEQLYPLALRPLPSCAIVQFEPDPTQGNLAEGYRLPRDTALFVTTRGGDSVHFRSSAEATLWPLAIDEATLLGGEEAQALTGVGAARSALRLSLRCLGEYRWDELSIERLRIHLAASPMGCAILYDLLAAHTVQVMAGAPGTPPAALRGLPEIVGFAADEALLPEEDGGHPGLRLLAEYFAFPDKFHFFDLPLSGALADGQTLYLYLVFDRAPTARLHLQAEDFQLGCAPAINLFPRTSEPLRPDGTRSEYRLVADSHRENSVEIHSIRAVRSVAGSTVQPVPAYYGCRHDSHLGTLYWHARRIAGLTPNRLGSDLLLSLVDTGFDPLREAPAFSLTAELLCTNRYLAERLGAGTALGFERPGPVAAARLRNAPSAQSQPRLDGQSRWRLVSQLTLNHLSLVEGPRALEALREILALHNLRDDASARRQIEGLRQLDCQRVVAHVGEDAWRGWRNGLEIRLRLDPQHFVGASGVLFSAVLAQFFSLYATANRFVRTVLQGGEDMATPGRLAALPLSQRLRRTPQRFELLQALLLLERERPQALPLGTGNAPRAEALRLRGPLLPLFASSEVESLLDDPQQPVLSTPVFGLGGPDGPLPYAYQEWLQQRARQKDHAPAEFLDLFQHRLLSLLYRVLRKHRVALGFAVPAATPVQAQLRALSGLLPKALQERLALPDSAVLARTALFAGGRRSLAGFAGLVRQHFGVEARLDAYQGAWKEIPAASRSRLQRGGRNLRLGRDAIAGTRTWDEHAGIALSLGPLDAREAARFFPDGDAHGQLASLAALYFGPDLDCRLSLLVSGGAPLRLERGAPPRLSWNTGLRRVEDGQRQRIDLDLRQPEVA